VPHKSQHNFVWEMYTGYQTNDSAAQQALVSKHLTWFAVLYAIFMFTLATQVSEDYWLEGIYTALKESHVKCSPRSHRSCLTV
jgi:hypothetical protein